MNVSSSINSLNNALVMPSLQKNEEQVNIIQSKVPEGDVDISQLGMASSLMSGLSVEEQDEIASFTMSVQQSKQRGDFDGESLLKEAPESVNKLAKELNMSTEEMLTNISEKGPKNLITGDNEGSSSFAIDAYLNTSVNNDKSDSIFDLFNFFSNDEEK